MCAFGARHVFIMQVIFIPQLAVEGGGGGGCQRNDGYWLFD